MKKGLWNRRMPTMLAFVILLISIWTTSFLVQQRVITVGRASPDKTPQNITVSNISDSSFTVSFTTEQKTVSGVSVKRATSSYVVFDDRNKTEPEAKPFFSHFITIADLTPETKYEFSILSEGETYLDEGKSFSVTTGKKLSSSPPVQTPVLGKIIQPDGSPGDDSIVELKLGNSQILSILTKEDGSFILPTNSLRDSTLANYLTLKPNDEITITALKQSFKSQIKVLYENSQSLPPITLEQNYNFTDVEKTKIATAASQLEIQSLPRRFGDVRITTPRQSESFVDQRPTFRGSAIPNSNIKITSPVAADITSSANGSWSFRPESSLPPGIHKLTIETVDGFGVTRKISADFTIFPSGSQVADSATPSATPITTTAPTATPTTLVTPNVTVTTTPSATPSATPITTTAPTATPTTLVTPIATSPTTITTAAPTATNAPQVSLAPTGSTATVALTFVSVLLIIAGSALLFLL